MKRSLLVLITSLALLLYGFSNRSKPAPAAKTEPVRPSKSNGAIDVAIAPKVNPWSSLDLHNNPNNFQFAIVTDNTGGARPGVFEDAVARLNLIEPEFVMSVGDLIQGYTSNEKEIDKMWAEFTGFIGKLNMPFFYVPGNHDLATKALTAEWEKRFGRTYYHFRYRDVLFLCLNSDDPSGMAGGAISAEQIEYVRKALQENSDARWTLVFLHRPMWLGLSRQQGWDEIEKLLKPRKYTVFAGHLHSYMKYDVHGHEYIDLATTGGAQVRMPEDVIVDGASKVVLGTFDEVAWVTMTDKGPEVANLILDGIWSSDLRTSETGGWTRSLIDQIPVYVEPIFTLQKGFTRGTTTLRVVNKSQFPLTMRGRAEPGTALKMQPDDVMLEVPPKSEKHLELTLSSEKPVTVGDHLPVLFYWSLQYDTAGAPKLDMRKDLKLRGALRTGVVAVEKLVRQPKPVNVDGKLDEWAELPFRCEQPEEFFPGREQWHGPNDSSFKFATTFDDKFVYIAIRVRDDQQAEASLKTEQFINGISSVATDAETLFAKRTEDTWLRDGIAVRLDAQRDPDRSHNRHSKNVDEMILVGLNPPGEKEKANVYRANRNAVEIDAACVRCEGGYSAELAIPVSYLAKQGGDDWKSFRLNISVNDFDDNGDSFSQIWWRPDWSRDANYLGSGTFSR